MASSPQTSYPRACPIYRSIEVLGQKWSMLIIREAFWGRTRFADFRALGVPSDVLSSRLESLVAADILERHPYQAPGERVREEYVLTAAGHALVPVLAALAAWGTEHRSDPDSLPARYVDQVSGAQVRLAFVTETGAEIPASQVQPVHPRALTD